jgi:hypothetical protein
MTLKTSSNKTMNEFWQTYRWALKKSRGMAALLLLLIFIVLPMILLLTIPGWFQSAAEIVGDKSYTGNLTVEQIVSRDFSSFLGGMVAVTMALVLFFSLILCIQLFSYMQNKRSVDLFHALPVGRTPMLLGRWCAGLTVLVIPTFANFLIVEIIRAAYGIAVQTGFTPPLVQMLWVLLMGAAAFTFCMFMAVCSGTTLDTVLSILGVNAGYPVMILLGLSIAAMVLPGMSFEWRNYLAVITAFSPFSAGIISVTYSPPAGFLPWWIFLTLVLLAGSIVLYGKRRSETAEDNFSFPLPKIIIRFILTAAGGMALSLMLISATGGFLIGIVAGSVLAHVVVEAIYSRGFSRMKKSFRWYGIFAAVFFLFYGALATGFFGYDTRVPTADDVTSVTVEAGRIHETSGGGCNVIYSEDNLMVKDIRPVLTDKNNIQTVIDTQKKFVELYRADQFPYLPKTVAGNLLTVTYQLKDGRTFTRNYQYLRYAGAGDSDIWKKLGSERLKISNLPEYIQGTDMIFHVGSSDISTVDMNPGGNAETSYAPDEATKQELLDALRQDLTDGKFTPPSVDPKAVNASEPRQLFTIRVNFKDSLEVKDSFVKAQVGNSMKKFKLNGGGNYTLYDKDSQTYQLAQKLGWLS